MERKNPSGKGKETGLKVFISSKQDSTCDECKEDLGPTHGSLWEKKVPSA